ncbi:MAG: hypothetical protein AMXMBFR64_24680 [Myxococcales bacterium]
MKPSGRIRLDDDGAGSLSLAGELDRDTIPEVHDRLLRAVSKRGAVSFDLAGVERIDSAGVALFGLLARRGAEVGAVVSVTALSDQARRAFELFRVEEDSAQRAPAKGPGLLERVGLRAERGFDSFVDMLSLIADTFAWSLGGARRTRRVRKGAVWVESVRIGVNALPIVGLISFLVGVVVALQSAYQLRQFGASIYVANLIAVSMTREMGPLMTAILMAGRSGASIAAEVGTMVVSQEVDALRTMGLHPIRYIVVPKFQAMTLTMPALVVYASSLGIFGGFLAAWFYLGLGPETFFTQVLKSLVLKDLWTGLLKSVVFAWVIVLIAANRGFQVRGGAEAVGLVTTASVVSSIFWVIVVDAMFSMIFYFGD